MPVPTFPRDAERQYTTSRRQLRLLAHLESGRSPFWLHQLAARFEVTARTIRRDLGFLASLGAEIETSGTDTDDHSDIRCRVFYRRPAVTPDLPTFAAIVRLGGLRKRRGGAIASFGPRHWRNQERHIPSKRVSS